MLFSGQLLLIFVRFLFPLKNYQQLLVVPSTDQVGPEHCVKLASSRQLAAKQLPKTSRLRSEMSSGRWAIQSLLVLVLSGNGGGKWRFYIALPIIPGWKWKLRQRSH